LQEFTLISKVTRRVNIPDCHPLDVLNPQQRKNAFGRMSIGEMGDRSQSSSANWCPLERTLLQFGDANSNAISIRSGLVENRHLEKGLREENSPRYWKPGL